MEHGLILDGVHAIVRPRAKALRYGLSLISSRFGKMQLPTYAAREATSTGEILAKIREALSCLRFETTVHSSQQGYDIMKELTCGR